MLTHYGNQKAEIQGGYTAVPWSIDDFLAHHQTAGEQVAYRQLYRLSYGFGNTHCFIGLQTLARRTNLSKNTLRAALKGLDKKKHIQIVATVNEKELQGTVYHVFLPTEIQSIAKILPPDPVSDSDTVSKIDTGSKFDTVANSDTVAKDPVSKSAPIKSDIVHDLKNDSTTPVFNQEVHPYFVRPNRLVASGGEKRVEGNLALKVYSETDPALQSEPYLTPQEEAYIYNRPNSEQSDIFDAQDIWDEILGSESRPAASKLNEMLQHIRELGYKGEGLNKKFRGCLEQAKGKARDPVG